MSADDTPAEAALRAEVRAWMEVHAARFGPATGAHPAWPTTTTRSPPGAGAGSAELDDGGWACPTWPVAFGGRGFGTNEARIVREEEHRYAVARQAVEVGAADGRAHADGPRHRPSSRPRSSTRCAGASTSGASCSASPTPAPTSPACAPRPSRDGDELGRHRPEGVDQRRASTPTGRSCWPAPSPDRSAHRGITYFLLDMRTPGIDVRPLVQINRAAHFNEVHLDGVRVPADAVVGEVGEGWTVARDTLGAERAMIGSMNVDDRADLVIAGPARPAAPTTRCCATSSCRRPHPRLGARLHGRPRARRRCARGGQVGPEASVLKLGLSTLMGRLGELAMRVLGPEGLLEGGLDATDERGYGPLQDMFLSQWCSRIGGGTEQIQRNLIGERALGLPRDPRPS